MCDVGTDVVGVEGRGGELVVRIRVEVEQSVSSTVREAGEHLEKARQELARLVAAIREDEEGVADAERLLDRLTVGRRRERLEVDAVRNEPALDAAACGHVHPVAAHRHRNVDLAQTLDPARRQKAVPGVAVDREVEDPRRLRELELAPDVGSGEVRQPPHVGERDDGVRPVTEQVRI